MIEEGRWERRNIEDALDDLHRLNGEDAGELLLVRHAEPACRGADPTLGCDGLRQAEQLADRLNSRGFHMVYTAPERRAQQTSRILAAASDRPVRVLDSLADIDFDADGLAEDMDLGQQMERFALVPTWDSLPGHERSSHFRRRAIHTIERILAISRAKRVVVVTHMSVINAYLGMLLTVPADLFFSPDHSSVTTVRWAGDRYAVRGLNDISHLSKASGLSRAPEHLTAR